MLRNYLKIAVRNLLKHKLYTAINVGGLALALASCLLIFQFLHHEWGYDRFHDRAERIYRVNGISGNNRPNPIVHELIGPALVEDYAGVEQSARIVYNSVWIGRGESLARGRIHFADPQLFSLFSFPVVAGDPESALAKDHTAVISARLAAELFGKEDALGKSISLALHDEEEYHRMAEMRHVLMVGAVVEIPSNSSVQFALVLPHEAAVPVYNCDVDQTFTYVLLTEGADPTAIESQLPPLLEKVPFKNGADYLELQPIVDLHFDPRAHNAIDPTYSYILLSIALAIVSVACINYTNLSIAKASTRAREIGARKVAGAQRSQLMIQLGTEAVLLSLVALCLAMALAEFFLPIFNELVQVQHLLRMRSPIDIDIDVTDGHTLGIALGIALGVGLGAGTYPAIFLSGLRPVQILKNTLHIGGRGILFSRGLVALQAALSIFLVVCALAMDEQMHYVQNKDLGFAGDQVVFVRTKSNDSAQMVQRYRNELAQYPFVTGVSGAQMGPGATDYWRSDLPLAQGEISVHRYGVDVDFVQTLGIRLVAGRDFSLEISSDAVDAVLINETLARRLGWDEIVGQRLRGLDYADAEGRYKGPSLIVGVVEDLHLYSLHREIPPAVFQVAVPRYGLEYMYVRLDSNKIAEGMQVLRQTALALQPGVDMEFAFLDDIYDAYFSDEERWGKIVSFAAALAVFVACLGLLGLVSFTAERRHREIGIRKVLGASLRQTITLLSKDFARLILWANLLAWPVAFVAMSRWLENFPYRVELGVWVFAGSSLLVLVLALLTVGGQAAKAALANPVEALRCE